MEKYPTQTKFEKVPNLNGPGLVGFCSVEKDFFILFNASDGSLKDGFEGVPEVKICFKKNSEESTRKKRNFIILSFSDLIRGVRSG